MRGTWRFISTVIGIIFRHPITGTTMIPVLPDGRIVLVQRSDNRKWGLPGGIIDWGEDIPHAAERELKEETGLDLVKIARLVGVYSSPDRDPRLHSISVLLEVQVTGELAGVLCVSALLPSTWNRVIRSRNCWDCWARI